MFRSAGFRISLYGGIIFMFSAAGLIFLPMLVAAVGMFIGGVMVWGGFLQTMYHYYVQNPPQE